MHQGPLQQQEGRVGRELGRRLPRWRKEGAAWVYRSSLCKSVKRIVRRLWYLSESHSPHTLTQCLL
jgi:hypothetical protein